MEMFLPSSDPRQKRNWSRVPLFPALIFGFDVSDGGDQIRAAAFEELQASGASTGTAASNPASLIDSQPHIFSSASSLSCWLLCYATLKQVKECLPRSRRTAQVFQFSGNYDISFGAFAARSRWDEISISLSNPESERSDLRNEVVAD